MSDFAEVVAHMRQCSNRFARPGYKPPDHLRGAKVQLFDGDTLAWEAKFSSSGMPPILPNAERTEVRLEPKAYSLRILDAEGTLLFADHEFGLEAAA